MKGLTEPTLLLDETKCRINIQSSVDKARANNLIFRPHFKTHQSHTIGRWYRDAGVDKITVSSLKMAEYFALDGWQDITVAFPLNVPEIDRIRKLSRAVRLNLLLVSEEPLDRLAAQLDTEVNFFLEIDNGYHRTGVNPEDFQTIDKILDRVQKHPLFRFSGFLSHAGHSYKVVSDKNQLLKIHEDSIKSMMPLRDRYARQYPDLVLSTGDTPTFSVATDFTGIDEVRPGNGVFYDLAQHKIGSCGLDQIAVAMACPVVAKYPDRQEIIIYGGGVHFSKDFSTFPDGTPHYGKVVKLHEAGWDIGETGLYIKSLSQEHGIVHAPKAIAEQVGIGDFLCVLPVHSCLTSDAMRAYVTLGGETISRL